MAPPGQPRTHVCGSSNRLSFNGANSVRESRVLVHGFVFPGVGVMAVTSLRDEGEDFSEAHLHCFFSGLFSGMSRYAALTKALEVVAWYLVRWLFVFLKYMFTDALKFEKAPQLPSWSGGDMAVAAPPPLIFSCDVQQILSLWSLY